MNGKTTYKNRYGRAYSSASSKSRKVRKRYYVDRSEQRNGGIFKIDGMVEDVYALPLHRFGVFGITCLGLVFSLTAGLTVSGAADIPAIADDVVEIVAHQENVEPGAWSDVTADDFAALNDDEKIELVGAIAHDDEILTGIPAEVTAAQMIKNCYG